MAQGRGAVGAVRLARVGSPWVRRFYGPASTGMAAVQGWIGGKPAPRPARLPGHR